MRQFKHLVILVLTCGLAACSSSVRPATFDITLARPDDRVAFRVEGETAILDIYSPRGIGSAEIAMGEGQRPRRIVMRFHLKGLEELRFTYGQVEVMVAVASSGDNRAREHIGSANEEISPTSPHWMAVRLAAQDGSQGRIQLQDGYIEVEAPRDFLAGGSRRFAIRWIDFYR